MGTQQFKQGGSTGGEDDVTDAGQAQITHQSDTSAFDSMLDEIDGVLESNATEFVSGFVQKGGE